MAQTQTLTPDTLFFAETTPPGRTTALGLLIAWAPFEPTRVGEVLLLPPDAASRWHLIGRGGAQTADPHARLEPVRQRPGSTEPRGALTTPSISRQQLRVRAIEGGLQVESLGRCALKRGGETTEAARLAPGELISLQDQMLLMCVTRRDPMPLPREDLGLPLHPFGEADRDGVVGESPEAWELREQTLITACRAEHTLILGASGAGKELVASALHARSGRSQRPLISRNATTLPEGLIEAELFGNVRGYPNPGMPERLGLVGEAEGSTLFLDEIGDLPIELQARLLRFMDRGELQRLGEAKVRRADVRVIAATNRAESSLKHDLRARFPHTVRVPDLNRRREDIPLLIRFVLRRLAARYPDIATRYFEGGDPKAAPRMAPDLVLTLITWPYETNLRELEALLWRAIDGSDGRHIRLPADLRPAPPAGGGAGEPATGIQAAPQPDPPAAAPAVPLPQSFTPRDEDLLSRYRAHHFDVSGCARDPAFPLQRATADVHLIVLICKALEASSWHEGRAADLLAGTTWGPPRDRIAQRIDRTLGRLRTRLAAEGEVALRRSLHRTYHGQSRHVEAVISALVGGALAQASDPTPPSSGGDRGAR